jgi:predicted alpha-1,6-mannanase (GH76 family)
MEKYVSYATAAAEALQHWYNPSSGLWESTGWWNAANALGALIDYMSIIRSDAYLDVVSNTFDKNKRHNFLNKYYDDGGWWALTWIKAYDLTKNHRYLSMAKTIFNDMRGGWDNTCGGGIWWNKDRKYKNAITNELFLALAARLYRRTSNLDYFDWAQIEWTWFHNSGMINARNQVNDGLNSACANNGETTWTYNQGVILGGLADMYGITQDLTYLRTAEGIADAAISTLVNANGILTEPCEPNCGADGPQFKGIFIRNLAYLFLANGNTTYKDFILKNADSLWLNSRNAANQFGLSWSGPIDVPDAARQSSAQDALNAAMQVSGVS